MKQNFICTTCGVQYQASTAPPARCGICQDERQYVNIQGQTWTTQSQLAQSHHNTIAELSTDLFEIRTSPAFGIGQRALLVRSPGGNILWDCLSLLDTATIDRVQELGGIRAIAVSHPHFYGAVVDWSQAFGGVPVYLHAADQAWVMRPDPVIQSWEQTTLNLWDGMQLIRAGGHFPGSSVLLWPAGAGGSGTLLTGDTLLVTMDRKSVSCMYSYPNLIPLRQKEVEGIRDALAGCVFDQIYAGFDKQITENGRQVLNYSLDRYLQIYR